MCVPFLRVSTRKVWSEEFGEEYGSRTGKFVVVDRLVPPGLAGPERTHSMIEPAAARVTAVVPTRNRLALLRQTIDTVLGQRGVDMCAVVVDDGLDDPRVTVVHHDVPHGSAAARNAGLAYVTTPWVAFCDDDDLWAPDKCASQLAAIAATPGARWSAAGTVSVDDALQVVGHQRPSASGDVLPLLEAHNVIPAGGSSVLAATELVEEAGGFDPGFRCCEDYECWLRFAQRAPIACVDRPVVAYRVGGHNRSNDVELMRVMHEAVIRKHRVTVEEDDAARADLLHAQYLARFPLRQGRRFAAARAYFDIAWRFRQRTHYVHALLALAIPGFAEERRARAERAEVPATWVAAAEVWLAPLRRSHRLEAGIR